MVCNLKPLCGQNGSLILELDSAQLCLASVHRREHSMHIIMHLNFKKYDYSAPQYQHVTFVNAYVDFSYGSMIYDSAYPCSKFYFLTWFVPLF
jgi:hypothetical protein